MTRIISRLRCVALIAAGVLIAACAESTRERATGPEPVLDAYLQVPDTLPQVGAKLVVMIRISGTRANKLGSFTGRLTYDTTALTFVRETELADGGTRVVNPLPGTLRAAAIHPSGFGDSPIAAYEFIVKSPSAVASLALTVEELHDIANTNAVLSVRRLPTRVVR